MTLPDTTADVAESDRRKLRPSPYTNFAAPRRLFAENVGEARKKSVTDVKTGVPDQHAALVSMCLGA